MRNYPIRYFDNNNNPILSLKRDRSPNINTTPPACMANGRFIGGRVIVNMTPPAVGSPSARVTYNGIDKLGVDNLNISNVPCTILTNIPSEVNAVLNFAEVMPGVGYRWYLSGVPVGTDFNTFTSIRIDGFTPENIIDRDQTNNTLATLAFPMLVDIFDDDTRPGNILLPFYQSHSGIQNVFQAVSVYPRRLKSGAFSNTFEFDSNTGDDGGHNDYNYIRRQNYSLTTGNYENPNFWVSYTASCWQDETINDFDPTIISILPCQDASDPNKEQEGPIFFGYTPREPAYNNLEYLSNTQVTKGSNITHMYREVIRELLLKHTLPNIYEEFAVAHEIGHQFGLGHGNNIPGSSGAIPEWCVAGMPCGQAMGIMAQDPLHMMNGNRHLIPRFQNLIRSRIQSPGF